MELDDHLLKYINRTKSTLSTNKDNFMDYLMKYELKSYFSDSIPENEKSRLKSKLEEKLKGSLDKYDSELGGLVRKAGSKGSMGFAVLNDLSSYLSNVPTFGVDLLSLYLFGAKTIAEIPSLVNYLKKSKDWYGVTTHLGLKPARYLMPVVGPALESGAFDRMVRKRVLKESKYGFIKDVGDYESFENRFNNKLKQPISNIIDFPGANREFQDEPKRIAA